MQLPWLEGEGLHAEQTGCQSVIQQTFPKMAPNHLSQMLILCSHSVCAQMGGGWCEALGAPCPTGLLCKSRAETMGPGDVKPWSQLGWAQESQVKGRMETQETCTHDAYVAYRSLGGSGKTAVWVPRAGAMDVGQARVSPRSPKNATNINSPKFQVGFQK